MRGAGGGGGVKARFLNGGSPRFLVDNLLFSDMEVTAHDDPVRRPANKKVELSTHDS